MKQHITKKQWDELNEEQKSILVEHYHKMNPLSSACITCNIGQMMEFLGDDLVQIIHLPLSESWEVYYFLMELTEREELRDALWEAVKHKLIYETKLYA